MDKERLIKVTEAGLAAILVSQVVSLASALTPARTAVASVDQPRILLDLAHRDTENDCGAVYQIWNERDIVNPITDKVANILVNKGFSVTLTRSYDSPISINDRVALANRTDFDYYVSIHANSCANPNTGTGIEAYYNGNAAKMMADHMLQALSQEFNLVNRGNYETKYYTSYIHDSVLFEVGFVNHDRDRQIMLENQDRIAELIAESIVSQFSM